MKLFRNWTFTWWEVSLIKLCLLSLGILFALYFYQYLLDLLWLWWTTFLLTLIYFITRLFREEKSALPQQQM